MVKYFLISVILIGVISCNKPPLTEKEKQIYVSKGKEIAQTSFKELSSNLMQQMKLGGSAQAVPFCNLQAMSITNKIAEKYNVTIKRASNKVRNVANKASERELKIIKNYQKLKNSKKELIPIVEINSKGEKHFYAPIIVTANCLVCHGKKGKELSVKTDSIIKLIYINDTATEYIDGDLRGIWSISFKN